MNRRSFIAGAAAALACAPSVAAPIDHPHDRLSEVWVTMRRTRGGPRAMRDAVERVFGAGILRFSNKGAVVLLDTTSIDFYRRPNVIGETSRNYAGAAIRMMEPRRFDRGWVHACPIPCT